MIGMRVEDYFQQDKRWWFRLHQEHVDAWVDAAGIEEERKLPLFRSFDRNDRHLADRGLYRQDVLRKLKRRVRAAGLREATRCHTFNGGTVAKAQAIAAHHQAVRPDFGRAHPR